MASEDLQPARDSERPQAPFAQHIGVIEQGQWTAMLLDPGWRISWVSPELQGFLGETDPDRLGFGLPAPKALLMPAWAHAMDSDSMGRLLANLAPVMLGDLAERGVALEDVVPPDLLALFDDVEPMTPPQVWTTDFHYLHPEGVEELGGYTVKALAIRLRGSSQDIGWLVIFDIDVPPQLVSLLARGDRAMCQRMARLVRPGSRAAAILFCDLRGSGVLSRKLPTAEYFRLVRTCGPRSTPSSPSSAASSASMREMAPRRSSCPTISAETPQRRAPRFWLGAGSTRSRPRCSASPLTSTAS